MDRIFAKCEKCGKHPRGQYTGRGKGWCQRCVRRCKTKETMNPSTVIVEMRKHLGDSYLEADLGIIQEPYRTLILEAPSDIYLWGGIGVGKTFAMAALFKHLLFEGHVCQRINFDDFCCKVRSTMNKKSIETEYEVVKEMVFSDALFIDDIGLRSKQETDFAYVTLYTILNKRQENNLPTYITTNKPIDKLAETFDARIASRLKTATIIEMKGTDRRLTK